MGEDQFNSTFDLCWVKVQSDSHKNLIQYNYRKFIKSYKVNNSHSILLKVKVLLKCVAYVLYKTASEHMGIKLGKSL